MADLLETLHTLARQRSRGESPLVGVRSFSGRTGTRISHLAISQPLLQAWVGLTGEPFHQHQSLALAALRRGEALALTGGRSARRTTHLLMMEMLRATTSATALLIVPDEQTAHTHVTELTQLSQALGEQLRVGVAIGTATRTAIAARIIICTPDTLHEHLLHHHLRAWAPFWAGLRLILLAEAQTYTGLMAVHLNALLLRAQRLSHQGNMLQFMATLAPVVSTEIALTQLAAVDWRTISAEDTSSDSSALALWRTAGGRHHEALALARALTLTGAKVHINAAPLEVPLLRRLTGDAVVSIGSSPAPADVQIVMSLREAATPIAQCRDGARLTVIILSSSDPAEEVLARMALRQENQLPLIDEPAPTWVVAPNNAYVKAQHLLCAASEHPIRAAEVEEWGSSSLITRLEQQQYLVQLPGTEPSWQPLPAAGDTYSGFYLRSFGNRAAILRDEAHQQLGKLDQSSFDRWGFVGAALPPLRGGYRVIGRDDEAIELTLQESAEAQRTLPLRRCNVQVREQRNQRELRGTPVCWGRVVVDEEIYGFRESTSTTSEYQINPPIQLNWSAPALWIDLPVALNGNAQLVGWSLTVALPLCSLCSLIDLVPAYDSAAQRIYLIDAQPGGNGLAVWLFHALDELLPLAYAVAMECYHDQLLEPVARIDTSWLPILLGMEIPPPRTNQVAQPVRPSQAPQPLHATPAPQLVEQATAMPDTAAMVTRLQQMRRQRERQEQRKAPSQRSTSPTTSRFQPGNHIFCMPYGYGEVVASRIEQDYEYLDVLFADFGQLTVDASLNAVRLAERLTTSDNDLL